MKKIIATAFLVVLLAFALPSGNEAEAAWNPEHDIRLDFYLPFDIPFLSEDLAWKMFDIQEALHEYLRNDHNIDLEYGYIWVYVNGKLVAAIDPPIHMINEGEK